MADKVTAAVRRACKGCAAYSADVLDAVRAGEWAYAIGAAGEAVDTGEPGASGMLAALRAAAPAGWDGGADDADGGRIDLGDY